MEIDHPAQRMNAIEQLLILKSVHALDGENARFLLKRCRELEQESAKLRAVAVAIAPIARDWRLHCSNKETWDAQEQSVVRACQEAGYAG